MSTTLAIESFSEINIRERAELKTGDWLLVLRDLDSELKGWDAEGAHNAQTDRAEVAYLMSLNQKPSLKMAKCSQQAWNEGAQ